MNELFKRTITGFIYTFLLLAAIMLNTDAFDFLFLSFGIICLFEFKMLIRLKELHIFLAFLFLWWLFIHLKLPDFMLYMLLLLILLTNISLILSLFNEKVPLRKQNNNTKLLVSLLYIGGGCLFVPLIYRHEDHPADASEFIQYMFNNESQITMIGILCIIWASDTFAYLSGRTFGKHKLFERISPKKTIEGFVGGLIGATAVAILFDIYSVRPMWQWIVMAEVLVVMGTIGDLVESSFKRTAGVKDSGTILPGHGGLLDRLDSLVFASPFAYLTLLLFDLF